MRLKDTGNAFTIWVSADDTYEWARRINNAWPCSELSGSRFVATFDTNGLLDLSVDGKDAPGYFDATEFNACVSDLAETRIPKDHPCYFVAIGQFKAGVA